MTKRTVRIRRREQGRREVPAEMPLQHQAGDLLSQADEYELVARMGDLRTLIDRLISPYLDVARESDKRLTYFDQRWKRFVELTRKRVADRAQIERLLEEYNGYKDTLVRANLRWVTKLARSHRNSSVAFEDLFQEGVCGLVKSIDRFEPSRELRLMTYATWYIREAMQQIRARHTHSISMSAHDQTLLGQMEEMKKTFLQKHGRLPEPKDFAERFGRPEKTIAGLQAAASPFLSVSSERADGCVEPTDDDPFERFVEIENARNAVDSLLETLDDRQKAIVRRRFGLDGVDLDSLEGLGESFNVSKERVRQIQRQAIKQMQQTAEKLGISA